MKLSLAIFFFFFSIKVFGQLKDTVYFGGNKKLILKSAKDAANRSLIELDGKVYNGTLESIALNDIDSFNVLDRNAAVRLFGDKGKNGAILFTMVDSTKNKIEDKRLQQLKDYVLLNKCAIIINRILYKGDINKIRGIDINNIDIVDSKYLLNYYGVDSKSGAVLVSTKQKIDPAKGVFIENQ